MSIHEGARAFKIEPSEARSFHMRGTLWTVLADGEGTDGVVGALDERCAHGIRAPMHVHDDADEIFYVLEGNLTFFVGEQRIEAASGAFVYLPRFVHHGFQCNSTEARVFNFVTPAGFEQLILDNGTPAHYDDGPIPDDEHATHAQLPPEVYARNKYHMRTLPPGSK
jgi:mannose-6-phosphate isomerase-like protein (cupin superfamily)